MIEFDNCSMKLLPSRWSVDIYVTDDDGTENHFIASADSSLADSGIWFGTKEEFDEAIEGWY